MLAIERKPLQAAVAAVGHDQQRRLSARIDPEAVRTIDLIVAFSQSAKGADELSLLVVLVDEA